MLKMTVMTMREEHKKKYKQKLLDKAQHHQQQLYADLNESSERVVVFGKNAIALSGALFVGYTILERFLDAKLGAIEKKKNPNRYETLNKIILPVLIFALQQGSMTLIRKARLLLIDYLEKQKDVLEE
jgi:hypothetical protein